MHRIASVFFLLLFPSVVLSSATAATTLDKIRSSGTLACGINIEEPEYTLEDAHGNHSAFDIDICKAVAAAVLGPGAKFTIKSYRDEADSLKALSSGEIALLATGSPHLRNSNGSFIFGHNVFYDYQGILVSQRSGITSARDLAGKKVCFLIESERDTQINGYMALQQIKFIPGPFSEEGEMEAALISGTCAAVTADVSQLAYERIAFKRTANKFEILPDIIAKDPLAPVVRNDDPQWAAIVDWTIQALIQAEESDITQSNVREMTKSNDVTVVRLLGIQRGWGQYLKLDDDWVVHVIESVGNYGEIFDRDLGMGSPMKLDRGMNNQWNHGGEFYANPIR
jgi:general L-amino acid transport system substrate-binding protein